MLKAFVEMKPQVSQFLDSNANGLTEFNLDNEEWAAVEDLVSVLKVRLYFNLLLTTHQFSLSDFEGCDYVFLC